MFRYIKDYVSSKLEGLVHDATARACDAYALSLLRPLQEGYIPWTRPAMRPSAICTILNDIYVNDRRVVVEFGSGVSTLFIARTLAPRQGLLVSFEDNARWTETLNGQIADAGLSGCAKVVHAPLAPCEFALDDCQWYDLATVRANLPQQSIDMLVVDGPKAFSEKLKHARYPAVPALRNKLSARCGIFLDDVTRRGETEVFRRWKEMLNGNGLVEPVAGNFGYISVGERYFSPVI